MKNWINELEKIYVKLEKNGFHNQKEIILNAQLSGGTGGEIFLLVTNELKSLTNRNIEVYLLIKDEVDNILNYGKFIGYLS